MMKGVAKIVVLGLLLACVRAINVTQMACTGTCIVNQILYPGSNCVLMMSDGFVYTSTDEGLTWTNKLQQVVGMDSFPIDDKSLVFVLGNGMVYRSTDGGVTTSPCTKPPVPSKYTIYNMDLHPQKIGWLLIVACFVPRINELECQVYYTQDYGSSWKNGPNKVLSNVAWSNDALTPNTIFAVTSTTDRTFGYTTDFGLSWVSLFPNSIGFAFTNNFLYVGQKESAYSSRGMLFSSSNDKDPSHMSKDYYWRDVFPTNNSLAESGYTFLDDSARSEYIALLKGGPNFPWGTVFTSDFYGDQFALSLNYVAQEQYTYDFDKFDGLAGIYIANAYETATSTLKQTLITYDNGGGWNLIPAPKTTHGGAPINCDIKTGCSLHLHGLASWNSEAVQQPPFYSSPNAIGLLIGVGNWGTSLSNNTASAKTYFTRDAGITWAEIFPEPTIYEFGDHGGILVFATTNAPTNRIYYSLDEGNEIIEKQFTTNAIYVDNIITEPEGTGRRFILLGHDSKNKHYVYGIDFTDLNLPICGDDDYEYWAPTNNDNNNAECFMGAVTYYLRRKQESECYNDRTTNHFYNQTLCLCDWEDYECDIDFTPSARNITDGFTCTPAVSTPGCATGYRKIPDTQCISGLDLLAQNCPGYSGTPTTSVSTSSTTGDSTTGGATNGGGTTGKPTTTTGGGKKSGGNGGVVFVIILFVFIFGSAAIAGVLYWKNDRFREFVQDKLFKKDQGYGRVDTSADDESEHTIA